MVAGGIDAQARVAYEKVAVLLDAAGSSFGNVARIVEYVTADGLARYDAVDTVRAGVLGRNTAALNTFVVERLLRRDALIEVEVTARADESSAGADGFVYLPSLSPVNDEGELVGEGDVAAQAEQIYRNAAGLLEEVGLSTGHIVKTVDQLTWQGLQDYRRTGRVRARFLGPVYPAATGVIVPKVSHPGAWLQVDMIAFSGEAEAVNPGWDRYTTLTYNPGVQAGDVLFLSGQAALDPETGKPVHEGDVVAQARYIYGNILTVVAAAGGDMSSLVKTVEFVTPDGLAEYRGTASVRSEMLQVPYPASTGVVCCGLLRPPFQIEVDATAMLAHE